jgi:hypothetical protein
MNTYQIEPNLTLTNRPARRCRVPLAHWQADQYAVAIRQPEDAPAPVLARESAGANQLGAAGLTACFWPGKPMPAAGKNQTGANVARGD